MLFGAHLVWHSGVETAPDRRCGGQTRQTRQTGGPGDIIGIIVHLEKMVKSEAPFSPMDP